MGLVLRFIQTTLEVNKRCLSQLHYQLVTFGSNYRVRIELKLIDFETVHFWLLGLGLLMFQQLLNLLFVSVLLLSLSVLRKKVGSTLVKTRKLVLKVGILFL